MADVPKAELVCRRHSAQWQMYSANGLARGVLKETDPHWHLASMVSSPEENHVVLEVEERAVDI
jgi:hypothetical protein